ncbi:RING-H2 finger protein [Actinidia chinensis var. chinensis]|uniref:RING-type E3 ubiquitin transferase n=1 Tax=Actinidia chinensis var. chinensis TaxID=1590841 RepID=A0A2R6PPM8_ACTCC|nr:RING-H2 finger protein [Actinidia chinensis var. chinensis]
MERLHRHLLATGDTALPPVAGGAGSYDGSDANFDSNMVIILAALLCALICALGLNSIVRCALRCSRRFVFDRSGGGGMARLAATGMKEEALCRIPVAAYEAGIGIPATECAICLGEFVAGEKVRVLPKCRHGFHVKCIDTWLASHSSCPTCRQLLCEVPSTTSNLEEGQLRI